MSITIGKLMVSKRKAPTGTILVGFISSHPSDGGHGGGAVVENVVSGRPFFWDRYSLRGLPSNYRELVDFEPVKQ